MLIKRRFRPISLKTMEAVVWIPQNLTVTFYYVNSTTVEQQRCCVCYPQVVHRIVQYSNLL